MCIKSKSSCIWVLLLRIPKGFFCQPEKFVPKDSWMLRSTCSTGTVHGPNKWPLAHRGPCKLQVTDNKTLPFCAQFPLKINWKRAAWCSIVKSTRARLTLLPHRWSRRRRRHRQSMSGPAWLFKFINSENNSVIFGNVGYLGMLGKNMGSWIISSFTNPRSSSD